jgi:hypothetical protein
MTRQECFLRFNISLISCTFQGTSKNIFCVLNCHFLFSFLSFFFFFFFFFSSELLNCLWKFKGARTVDHVDAEVEHVNYECICRVLIFQEFSNGGLLKAEKTK